VRRMSARTGVAIKLQEEGSWSLQEYLIARPAVNVSSVRGHLNNLKYCAL
jgi:hypothetical protein